MTQVPQDLITEILPLLPVKTLVRFRCISKSFCCFIDSPDFIKSHLTGNFDNRAHRKLIFKHIPQYDPVRVHVLDIDEYDPVPIHVLNREGLYDNKISVSNFAHCNGLVLLKELDESAYEFNLVVWNPSTNKRRIISTSPTDSRKDRLPSYVDGFGIGYDSTTDDYKIILIKVRQIIICGSPCGDFNSERKYEIWILGLRSGYWRKIENPIVGRKIEFYSNCFVDNAFHIILGLCVCAFDVTKETFSRVSLPIIPTDLDLKEMLVFPSELQVREGCLSISYLSYWMGKKDLYVRKKNVDGGEFYWIKLFSIKYDEISCIPFGSDISYLGFSEVGDDEIFVLDDKYVLCTYDFKEKRTKRIVIGDRCKQNVIFCNESLVDPFDYPVDEQGMKEYMRILDQQILNFDWVDYNMEDAKEKMEMMNFEMEEQQRQEEIWLPEFDAVDQQAFKFMEKFDSMSFNYFGGLKNRKKRPTYWRWKKKKKKQVYSKVLYHILNN